MTYAIKGKPDFHTISDERLKSYLDLSQQMIFAYKYHDSEKTKVLEQIWKDISVECTDRLAKSAIESIEKEGSPATIMKKVPKIRKSPAKRRS